MGRSSVRILVAVILLAAVLFGRTWVRSVDPRSTAVPTPPTATPAHSGTHTAPEGTEAALAQAHHSAVETRTVQYEKESQLTCTITPALEEGHGYLAIGGHSEMKGRDVHVLGGKIYVPYVYTKPRPDGKPVDPFPREGWLAIAGFAPVHIEWSERDADDKGTCATPVALPAESRLLSGKVTRQISHEPEKDAWVEGCGNRGLVEDDGTYRMSIVGEGCTVRAFYQPYRDRAGSLPAAVAPGGNVALDLEIPG